MQYRTYRLMVDEVAKHDPQAVKKFHLSREKVELLMFQQAVKQKNLIALDVALIDSRWEQKKDVWFVEPQVEKLVNDPRFFIDLSCVALMPHPVMVCLDSRSQFLPTLVQWTDVRTRRAYIQKFYRSRGLVAPDTILEFECNSPDIKSEDTKLFEVSFCRTGIERMRTILPESRINDALSGQWWDECDINVDDIPQGLIHPKFIKETEAGWTEDDMKLHSAQVSFILRLMMYVTAFPGSLVPGFPANKDMMGRFDHQAKGHFIGLPEHVRNSPSPHIRNGHLRVLRDERFTRDASGNPRVVYVHPAMVAMKDATPSTVVEANVAL